MSIIRDFHSALIQPIPTSLCPMYSPFPAVSSPFTRPHASSTTGDVFGGLPRKVRHWSLTTLREKLIKIGAKIVHHARYVFFQMAEVAVPRDLFAAILERIVRLRPLMDTG